MAVTKKLQMVFALADGKKLTYSLPDPKDDITKDGVDAVMNEMIAKNVIVKGGAAASKIAETSIRTTETVAL
ncbi:DUF2922 domain-containing protein [Pectinatus sottacetonis]|uniref:DUF2922 domain-containing protein n=1 Tax=Pectinatus sottacetonis TaxID=1002795 RepID=UPI0018C4D407|nr:DUF2922 domain-containing protein [Pectinatus sottacetonis]